MAVEASATLSVHEAAELLGRDRTRIYALVRSGDLVGVSDPNGRTLRIDRSSLERWQVAGGTRGSPQTGVPLAVERIWSPGRQAPVQAH